LPQAKTQQKPPQFKDLNVEKQREFLKKLNQIAAIKKQEQQATKSAYGQEFGAKSRPQTASRNRGVS
jgi:hypothetical protein